MIAETSLSQESSTILLIEADPWLQRLIMLGLQHSGMRVIAARSVETLPALDTHPLDLLVLDVDAGTQHDWSLLTKVQSLPQLAELPTVVLTWDTAQVPVSSPSSEPQLAFLDKPFDARALYRIIKQLLTTHAAQKAARLALAEAAVLAAYSRRTAPSVWPFITAAGLLLAVMGLLFYIALTIAGLLIVVVALLLWTTGVGSPSPQTVVLDMPRN